MNTIPVGKLWPGDIVVSEERLASVKKELAEGKPLHPITVLVDADRHIVRDGNNRVRAWIEHHYRAELEQVPEIPFTISTGAPPGTYALDGLRRISGHCGCGLQAFLKLPVVKEADYQKLSDSLLKRLYEVRKPK